MQPANCAGYRKNFPQGCTVHTIRNIDLQLGFLPQSYYYSGRIPTNFIPEPTEAPKLGGYISKTQCTPILTKTVEISPIMRYNNTNKRPQGKEYHMNLKTLIQELSAIMTVSGYEYKAAPAIETLLAPHFDSYTHYPTGAFTFRKNSQKKSAPTLLIDAHIDEIGFMVTEICDGGFLHVINVGGIDTRIMPASEVLIYPSNAAEPIRGIVASTPPHLQKKGDQDKKPAVYDLLIDTGYTKEALSELVKIGDPVGFLPDYFELLNGQLSGKGFDDKACAAIAAYAAATVDKEALDCHIILQLSYREECAGMIGARTGAFRHMDEIDGCIVMDVNFGLQPEVEKKQAGKLGEGPMISISVVTDRKLTQSLIDCAADASIPHQTVIEATNTGTNANVIPLIAEGIPTAVLSLPIKNMHTYSEILSLTDAENTALLLQKFFCGGFRKWLKG